MTKNSDNSNISEGFIRLPRSLLESEAWNNLRIKQQKLFLYILQRAQYIPYLYKYNGKDIQLMPGELCISLRRLVDDFNDTVKFKDEKIDLPFLQRAVSAFLKVGLTDTRSDTGITIIRVIYSGIYDSNNHLTDTRSDTLSIHFRYSHLKEERKKEKKKENHPSIPSFRKSDSDRDDGLIDDFSSFSEKQKEQEQKIEIIPDVFLTREELDVCVKLKGDVEKVKSAIRAIQRNPKRKRVIKDWPTALEKWKIENKIHSTIKENICYSEKICREFIEFGNSHGWRCSMYTDRKKDQRGVLFQSISAYKETFFVSLSDGKFKEKCENFIATKKMRNAVGE